MPKLKTKKSIKKRMKITKLGKVKRRKPFGRHYKAGKNGDRRRSVRGSELCQGKIAKNMKRLIAPAF
ncbi:MAG: 50S ribosomal protein L35 [Planctomycetota bacterium]|jgi:ribosomal protein L35|nr:50S ribosomal protein L35 [Planctomycetota bacterium]